MPRSGIPYCTYCLSRDVTVTGYEGEHYESRRMKGGWGTTATMRSVLVPATADYNCNACGRSGQVNVDADYEPPVHLR